MFGVPHEAKILEVLDIVEHKFAQHEKTMTGVVQNLIHQGKMEEAEWTQHNIKAHMDNFSHMASAFLARQIMDTTHSFCVKKKLELSWGTSGCHHLPTWLYIGQCGKCFKTKACEYAFSQSYPERMCSSGGEAWQS